MRLLIFLPDDDALRAQQEQVLAAYPGLTRILRTELAGGDPRAALGQAMKAAGPKGFAILDPPSSLEELKDIDRLCVETFGKKRKSLPRAIFFAPRPPKKGQADPFEAYRTTFKDRYHHYHKDRRSLTFEKPAARPLKRAVKLAGKAHSPIRWILLGPMALAALGVVLLLFAFRDSLLRQASISSGESHFRAAVEVGDLATTLSPSIELQAVAVADRSEPMRNLFEFERFSAALDLGDLLGGRFHMSTATLEGLAFDTERSVSGLLSGDTDEEADGPEESSAIAEALSGRLDGLFEELLSKLEPPALDELHTTRVAAELQAESERRLARLEARITDNPALGRLSSARDELNALLEAPLPPSVERVQAKLGALGDLGSKDRMAELEAELAEVARIDFGAEGGPLDQAKAELQLAESEVRSAKKALEAAADIEDADMRTLLKLPKILKEVQGSLDQLKGSRERVANARALLEQARSDLDAQRTQADGRLASLREELNTLKSGASTGTPTGLAAELETAKRELADTQERATRLLSQVQTDLTSLAGELESIRALLADDQEFLAQAPEKLRVAMERDKEELLARYSLDSFDAERIVEALMGDGVLAWLKPLEDLYERIRPSILAASDGVTVRSAGNGVIYEFPSEGGVGAEPTLWIEAAKFSGEVLLGDERFALEGTGKDISSSPALLGRASEIDFTAELGTQRLAGDLSLRPDQTLGARVEVTGFALDGIEFEGRYAPREASSEDLSGTLDATFDTTGLSGTVDLRLAGMKLTPPTGGDLDPRLGSLLADVYGRFDLLEARLEFLVRDGEVESMKVTSNIGDELQSVLDESLTREVESAKAEMQAGLDDRLSEASNGALGSLDALGPRGEELLSLFTDQSQSAEGGVGEDQGRIQSLLSSLSLPSAGAPASDDAVAQLEAALSSQSVRLEQGHASQSGAIETLLGNLLNADEATSSVDSALADELKRLLKLR